MIDDVESDGTDRETAGAGHDADRYSLRGRALREAAPRLQAGYEAHERGRLDGMRWAAAQATRQDLETTYHVLRAPWVMGDDLRRALDALHAGRRAGLTPLPGWLARQMVAWPDDLWILAALDADTLTAAPPQAVAAAHAQGVSPEPALGPDAIHAAGDARYRPVMAHLGADGGAFLQGWRGALIELRRDLRRAAAVTARAERAVPCPGPREDGVAWPAPRGGSAR